MDAIQIQGVSKSFGTTRALDEITLSVPEGELFGLIGPDGAGKTTLIRILTSLLYPATGSVHVLGLDPVAAFRQLRKKLGYMPGRFSLYQDLTVEENIRLFASIFETTLEKNYVLIRDIYQQIEPFKNRKAGALSGGMKQKLALSCAMIHKPDILFLDEPTTGVDPVSRKEFWDMLHALNRDGLTIFVSTPYMDEADRCHRVGLIQEGRLLAVDTPAAISHGFDHQLFAIQSSDKFGLIRYLRAIPSHRSVFSFGSEIHYTDKNPNLTASQMEELLSAWKANHPTTTRKINPGIEDSFMSLMLDERN
ncbi:MAG: ABC transporter ATP-binding protein [Cyclobacteriaceae bacterium]|nr:ABC transporter ATP-binding protein [Cyclobacteriaceae bacterium]